MGDAISAEPDAGADADDIDTLFRVWGGAVAYVVSTKSVCKVTGNLLG